jgi:hypothetical protein
LLHDSSDESGRAGSGAEENASQVCAVTGAHLFFVCDYAAGTPGPTEEALEAGWFTPEEAREMVTSPHIRKALTDMLDFDGKTSFSAFIRNEDGSNTQVSEEYIG